MNQHADTTSFLEQGLKRALKRMEKSALHTQDLSMRITRTHEDGSPATALLHTGTLSTEHARLLTQYVKEEMSKERGWEDVCIIASGDTPTAAAHVERKAETKEKKRPAGVASIIQVISGKGGAGKTTIAAAIAFAYQQQGKRVALVDGDIYGPSFPSLFGLTGKPGVDPDSGLMRPLIYDGPFGTLPVMSLGFITGKGDALAWRGPMAGKALMQLFFSVTWPETDVMIVDMPPGTGDAHLTAGASIDISHAIAVTQPSALSEADAARAVSFCKKISVPVAGIIENMAYIQHGNTTLTPFGTGGGAALAAAAHAPLLASLPLLTDSGDDPVATAHALSSLIAPVL